MSKQKSESKYRCCNECSNPFILPKLARNRYPIYCPFCDSDNIAIISRSQYIKEANRRIKNFMGDNINA